MTAPIKAVTLASSRHLAPAFEVAVIGRVLTRMIRRAFLPVLVGLVCVPPSFATQGGNIEGIIAENTGGRVNIYRSTLAPGQVGGAIMVIREDDDPYADSGIAQVGYVRQGSGWSGSCGAFTDLRVMVEFRSSPSGPYRCHTYLHDGATANRFAMVRDQSGGVWTAYKDGAVLIRGDVNFNFGASETVGEYVFQHGTVNACFGCSGFIAWQITHDYGSSYLTVYDRDGYFDAGGEWVVQAPPSPFRVYN